MSMSSFDYVCIILQVQVAWCLTLKLDFGFNDDIFFQ